MSSATDIEQRLREQGSIEERLRLPISESMFVRRSDMLRALFAERAEAADTIASLRSKLEEAEGALPPVKPLDLAAVIRDAFLAGSGMDTSKRETQRIPEDVYERLNKYDPEHVPAFKRLEALLSAAYRARRTLASLREADHA